MRVLPHAHTGVWDAILRHLSQNGCSAVTLHLPRRGGEALSSGEATSASPTRTSPLPASSSLPSHTPQAWGSSGAHASVRVGGRPLLNLDDNSIPPPAGGEITGVGSGGLQQDTGDLGWEPSASRDALTVLTCAPPRSLEQPDARSPALVTALADLAASDLTEVTSVSAIAKLPVALARLE